jgi:hypothetical protein
MIASVYYLSCDGSMYTRQSFQEGTVALLRFCNESYTLYTSWLGLMGERRGSNQRGSSRQPTGGRWRGISYFDSAGSFYPIRAYSNFCPDYISLHPHHPSESFSLFTSWLGFDGLEDAKASDQTAGSLTAGSLTAGSLTAEIQPAADQSQTDPYILHCIG